jgi:hypothetical protein
MFILHIYLSNIKDDISASYFGLLIHNLGIEKSLFLVWFLKAIFDLVCEAKRKVLKIL